MSVLTDTERRTEAVKTGADEKFARDPAKPSDHNSHEPLCMDESC
jgi:hypothetical protein